VDLKRISELLRMLNPEQEKVIRLYFGLGCQRPHSALEIAPVFGVSSQVIAGLLGAAERKLARLGLSPLQIREAVREQARLPPRGNSRRGAEAQKKSPFCHRSKRHL
jgi:DNA-directed RNA polymerase sigma subunit (sigma70/sigma32)